MSSSIKEIKLHLGCGERYIPNWIHIDQVDMPHIEYVTEVNKLDIGLEIEFQKGTVNIMTGKKQKVLFCLSGIEFLKRMVYLGYQFQI